MPSNIPRPDYAIDGVPKSESRNRQTGRVKVNTAAEIEAIRRACAIGRAALDAAGAAIKVGCAAAVQSSPLVRKG